MDNPKDTPLVSQELIATNRDIAMLQEAVGLVRQIQIPRTSDFE